MHISQSKVKMVLIPFPEVINRGLQDNNQYRYFAVSNGAGTETKYFAARAVDHLTPLEAVKRFLLSVITTSAGDIQSDTPRALAVARRLGLDRIVEVTEEEARNSPKFRKNLAVYGNQAAVVPLGTVHEEPAASTPSY